MSQLENIKADFKKEAAKLRSRKINEETVRDLTEVFAKVLAEHKIEPEPFECEVQAQVENGIMVIEIDAKITARYLF